MSKSVQNFYKHILVFIRAKQKIHLEARSKQTEKIVLRMVVWIFFYAFGMKEGM